ncbi:MAG TPA: amidoligase family protein, partial [Chloroflexota bacterium]|nr:amidoligase family protein [Chloroflexota bacterium]
SFLSGGTAAGHGSHSARPGKARRRAPGGAVPLPQDSAAVEWWLTRWAVEGDGVPYAAEGVLALWPGRRAETDRWTFGLEFEFAVADAGWVASELHARGLCPTPEPLDYHGRRAEGQWSVEQDRSVSSVFQSTDGSPPIVVGGEVVSPPLRDTAEAWQQVATVLEVLRQCGAEVNRSCGFHVHIGTDALRDAESGPKPWSDPALRGPHEPARDLLPTLSRLAMLASVCFEDLVFRLASAEGGHHRGRAVYYRHCRPLAGPLQGTYERLADLTDALGTSGVARRAALNLTNVGDPQKDTVEFRQCNGTLDGRVVQAFCRLCAALVGAARWQPEAALLPPAPLGTHWERRAALGESADWVAFDADPRPLWRFLAAVFPDGLPVDAAAALLWLYRSGRWQPGLTSLATLDPSGN